MKPPHTIANPLAEIAGGGQTDLLAARALTGFCALATVAACLLVMFFEGIGSRARIGLQLCLLGLLVFNALAWCAIPRGHARSATFATLLVGTLVNGLMAAWLGMGVHGQAIGLSALLVAVGGILLGPSEALVIALWSLAIVTGLYGAEQIGWIGGMKVAATLPSVNRAYTLGAMILAGFAAALVFARTHRNALERARLGEERLRELLRISTDWFWEQDADARFIYLSGSFGSKTGLQADSFLGRALWEVDAVLEPAGGWAAHRARVQREQRAQDERVQVRLPDGKLVALSLSSEPVLDALGDLHGWRGVGRDVTALARDEQRLRESEQMLERLFRASPDGVVLMTLPDGRIGMMNETLSHLIGIQEEEAIGRDSIELGFWNDVDGRQALGERLYAQGHALNQPARFTARSGRQIAVMVSATRFTQSGRDYMVATVRDVSEVERVQRESEVILNHASVGIALVHDKVFQRVNPMLERMFARPEGSLAGQSTGVIFPSDELYPSFLALSSPDLQGGSVDLERAVPRADGTVFLARLRAQAVDPQRPKEGGVIWVVEDITQRRQEQEQLSEAKEQAEAASRAKSAFLATMSHEIRTPLNGVLGMIRLALQEPEGDGRREQFLRHAALSAETLAGIISDILDLSKIEAGRLQLERTTFDLHELVQQLTLANRPIAAAKGLTLESRIGPRVPRYVVGDPVRVRQILMNYLGNALKFTLQGGIDLALLPGSQDGRVRMEVSDTGEGITPEVQQRLFKPFAQGDDSTTRRFGGTGLGLSICSELVALMCGQVGVFSRPGHGSLFWAELPLPEAAAPSQQPAGARSAAPLLSGLRVLVVEDHPVNMLIATETLKQWGADVGEADNGKVALQMIERADSMNRPYDAVLMDLHMPEMSGLEATRILRRRHDSGALPIIALTAAALASEQKQALAAGMNDFVSKPLDSGQLLDALRRVRPQIGAER